MLQYIHARSTQRTDQQARTVYLRWNSSKGPSTVPNVAQSTTVCNSRRLFCTGVLREYHTGEPTAIDVCLSTWAKEAAGAWARLIS